MPATAVTRITSTYIASSTLAGVVGILVIGRMQVVQGGVLGVAILLDRVRASYFGRGRR